MSSATERVRRDGRGRLSTIEQLPESADEAIAWANLELRERNMPQTEILNGFNARLADLGIKPVSKGAFSRYSVRVAIEARKLIASRQITDAVLSRMAPGERSDSTLAATELIKFRILEMIMGEEEPDPKLLAAATLALARLSTTALREAEGKRRHRKDELAEYERRRAAEAEQAVAETADQAVKIATEAGLGADRIAAIRKGVLGLAG